MRKKFGYGLSVALAVLLWMGVNTFMFATSASGDNMEAVNNPVCTQDNPPFFFPSVPTVNCTYDPAQLKCTGAGCDVYSFATAHCASPPFPAGSAQCVNDPLNTSGKGITGIVLRTHLVSGCVTIRYIRGGGTCECDTAHQVGPPDSVPGATCSYLL